MGCVWIWDLRAWGSQVSSHQSNRHRKGKHVPGITTSSWAAASKHCLVLHSHWLLLEPRGRRGLHLHFQRLKSPPDFTARVMMVRVVLSTLAQTGVITQRQRVNDNSNSRNNFQPCYPRRSDTKTPPHLLNSQCVYEIIFFLLTHISKISAGASRHCWSQPLSAHIFFNTSNFLCALCWT